MSEGPPGAEASSPTGRLPPALASPDFRHMLAGQVVSLTGSQMQQVAVAWQLWQVTQSAWSLGLLGLFRVIPILVFGIGGGVLADAVDRRRLLLATQGLLALGSIWLVVASLLGQVSAATLYTVSFASGVAGAFDAPARQALIPQLVPRRHLSNALSLYSTAFQLASVVGPALGGWVLGRWGPAAVYGCDVVSFGAVLGALLALRFRDVARPANALSLRAAWEGFTFLRGQPLLLSTMVLDFAATFFGGAMLLMPIFADDLLKVGPTGLGLLYAAQPVGALVAAVSLSLLPSIHRQGRAVLAAVAAYGVAIAAFGAVSSLPLALLALACSGAADTVSTVVRQTLRQLQTPDEMRGRVGALSMIFFRGGPQLGEVEAGFVARLFGPRASVISGGLLCLLSTLVTALAVPSLRRYTEGGADARRAA